MSFAANEIKQACAGPLQTFSDLSPEDRLAEAPDVVDALQDAVATVAASRRRAVRQMREHMTLQEIADLIGSTPQRVHQIEVGYNRHEKKARGSK